MAFDFSRGTMRIGRFEPTRAEEDRPTSTEKIWPQVPTKLAVRPREKNLEDLGTRDSKLLPGIRLRTSDDFEGSKIS